VPRKINSFPDFILQLTGVHSEKAWLPAYINDMVSEKPENERAYDSLEGGRSGLDEIIAFKNREHSCLVQKLRHLRGRAGNFRSPRRLRKDDFTILFIKQILHAHPDESGFYQRRYGISTAEPIIYCHPLLNPAGCEILFLN
jgi:hypothetical protein